MKKPRIVLISPPEIAAKNQIRKAMLPLGIAAVAASLREKGYSDILIIDALAQGFYNVKPLEDDPSFVRFGLDDSEIVEQVKNFNADIVGMSILYAIQTESAFSITKAIKKALPNVPIAMGGIHATFIAKETLENESSVDFAFTGEGDYTFPEFIGKYFIGDNFRDVAGLHWRENDEVKFNPRPGFTKDVDALPFPAWDLFNMERYFDIGMPHNPFVISKRVGVIISSRGCPHKCYFCLTPYYGGSAFRACSAKKTIEMIQLLVEKHGIKELQVMDDIFTFNPKRVVEICEGIKHFNLRIALPNGTRADAPIDHEKRLLMYKKMKEAGFYQITISVEHGDPEFLNNTIGKRLNLDEVRATMDLAHEAGLLVHSNFMMGFPFETAKNRQKTIDFARSLDSDSFSVSLACPLPGSGMYEIAEKNGLFNENYNVNRMVYVNANIKPVDISTDELTKIVENLNRELNTKARQKRKETQEKYDLFDFEKAHNDRKYDFLTTDGYLKTQTK